MIFSYAADGTREPFNPRTFEPGGCCLCGGGVESIGIFVPTTEAMRATVLKLRQHPARPMSTPCVAYGICGPCGDLADIFERIEAALEAAATKVVLQ